MDRLALPLGTRFGEMEIVRVLAVGGFGIVYLARDHALDRDVAIKEFLPSHLVCRGEGCEVTVRSLTHATTFALALESFVDEAKLLARFSHPAMVKVHSSWKANGTAYMAMPYLRGPTLWELRRSMTQPPTEVWLRSIVDPLLEALQLLHAERIYHRDVAPDNVVLTGTGLPVLLDFGAARRLIGDRTQLLTAVVKPHYAPIEQYAEATRLRQGPWTDLYALSSLVVYLLEGKPPPASTARSIHDDMHRLAERHYAGISHSFLSAIDWGLAVRPEDRPQDVDAFRRALQGPPPPRGSRGTQALVGAPRPGRPSRAPAEASTTLPGAPHRSALPRSRLWFRPSLASLSVLLPLAMLWPLSSNESSEPLGETPIRQAIAAPRPTLIAERVPMEPPPLEATAAPPDPTATESKTAPDKAAASTRPATSSGVLPAAKTSQSRKRGNGSRVVAAGPAELCADRNFFVKPFCVHRRCEEPRFTNRLECRQLQEANASRRF